MFPTWGFEEGAYIYICNIAYKTDAYVNIYVPSILTLRIPDENTLSVTPLLLTKYFIISKHM